jgi:hypothetical protein
LKLRLYERGHKRLVVRHVQSRSTTSGFRIIAGPHKSALLNITIP